MDLIHVGELQFLQTFDSRGLIIFDSLLDDDFMITLCHNSHISCLMSINYYDFCKAAKVPYYRAENFPVEMVMLLSIFF